MKTKYNIKEIKKSRLRCKSKNFFLLLKNGCANSTISYEFKSLNSNKSIQIKQVVGKPQSATDNSFLFLFFIYFHPLTNKGRVGQKKAIRLAYLSNLTLFSSSLGGLIPPMSDYEDLNTYIPKYFYLNWFLFNKQRGIIPRFEIIKLKEKRKWK